MGFLPISVCATGPMASAYVLDGFCVGILPIPTVDRVRSIVATGPTNFLTLERGTSSILVGEDLDGDGIPESSRTLVKLEGLNHGLTYTSTHVYASTHNEVYRWPYDPNTVSLRGNTPELVVKNISQQSNGDMSASNHVTRTLVIDNAEKILYVSVGSAGNIDPDSFRARIRIFDITDSSAFPFLYADGEVFADGIRNEVALDFAPDGVLWGACNGADLLNRPDLGFSLTEDNPAEEVHRFDPALKNSYGYPFCFREYRFPSVNSQGVGSAWAFPNSAVSDQLCRATYDPIQLAMQAHSAPLGMTFYNYREDRPAACEGVEPFPREMDGDLFIALHGSWNRAVPTGYKVVHVKISADGKSVEGGPGATPVDLLRHAGASAVWSISFRPVDVSFDDCGRLLVSSDGVFLPRQGAMVVRVERVGETTFTNTLQPIPRVCGDDGAFNLWLSLSCFWTRIAGAIGGFLAVLGFVFS